ncbi:Aminodeoxychorismate lyase, partial [human gut metagenome]
LFPATYTFKKNSDPTAVIDKLVETFQSRFTDDMKAKAASMGRSVHEVLTVASIIEKEAYTPEQRTLISSVLYNRLNNKKNEAAMRRNGKILHRRYRASVSR